MDSTRLETVPTGPVNLDTVRALHQTVVSLRTALEVSKNELKNLKEKYELHSHCLEYSDVIEKLTLENHILRRKIIDTGEKDFNPNIKLQVTYSPRSDNIDKDSEILIETATEDFNPDTRIESDVYHSETPESNCREDSSRGNYTAENVNGSPLYESPLEAEAEDTSHIDAQNTDVDISQATSYPKQENEEIHQPSFKTKLELLSKFDVRIKVRTLKEGASSSSTSDTDSTLTDTKEKDSDIKFEERKHHFEEFNPKGKTINIKSVSTDNVKMAVPNPEGDVKSKTDKLDVQVRITSEENLIVKENLERTRRKDTLNLDVDDLSVRSLSEGDNSVFSEGVITPVDPSATKEDDKQEHDASGNESEEVDDIELIFTTDESKDMSNLQEDLVPIRESDNWTPQSASTTHSTPVLIKFHTLDPDFQPGKETIDNAENENQENCSLQSEISVSSLKMKRVSLPSDKDIRHVAFDKGSLDIPGRGILKVCDNKSDNMLYRKSPNTSSRKLDSIDSLTCEYNRGLSLDNTKSSSFELGSSMDILHRDESVDSFHKTGHLGHRFSIFAETDISKCGISEDDLAANLNVRRNTCPNPFQYRVPPYRGYSRPMTSGPVRVRPVLRDVTAPRRDSAAQTDVSALPPRWSSDGYLAHKMYNVTGTSVAPTLPQRGLTSTSRRGESRAPPVSRRCSEARRVLLSDIGFTSMVPELSRSADPVWALTKKMSSIEESVTNSTSKFLSRGSSYRSPCPSIDRSNDWTNQHSIYVPSKDLRPWRSSLPDVRRDDTEELLDEAETFLRRSVDNFRYDSTDMLRPCETNVAAGKPYIPAEPRELKLGHTVKLITPQGRIAVGRVRYIGITGASPSVVMIGAEVRGTSATHNDGTVRGRRYFLAASNHCAVFVPFSKVVMAWTN